MPLLHMSACTEVVHNFFYTATTIGACWEEVAKLSNSSFPLEKKY